MVDLPPITTVDPAARVLANPVVAEDRRHCSRCNEPVGRGRNGVPGRTEGFCRLCAHPFSFTPKLAPNELVAGQYEVAGCLAHGGLGWIYLARDRRVSDRWVVLKGLLDTGDEDAVAAAVAERRFLAEVEHPNIVKIYNFVEHGDHGYAVMEYVGGISLRGLLEERRREAGGRINPLPVTHAIAYVLEILPAIGYLHSLGLLYCDFKPDNIIQTPTSLKLIDLGGVYRMAGGVSTVYGTLGYQAPEIGDTGPTIASDLFTVGRTLAVLCTEFWGYQTTYAASLPPPEEVPPYAAHDALYRFLLRATALDPDDRFESAEEMADQLLGVLRQVVADEGGPPLPGASTLFTGELRTAVDTPEWRSLPLPLVAPDDPAAGFLATLRSEDPTELLSALEQAPEHTIEIDYRRVLTLIESDRLTDADRLLSDIEAEDEWDWRISWFRGLAALAAAKPALAEQWFGDVRRKVPGELAPMVALGQAAEGCGDLEDAARWYDAVSRTDPGFTSAAFGLARCLMRQSHRRRAVEALDRVPEKSSAHLEAQVTKVRALTDATTTPAIDVADVMTAAQVIERLPAGSGVRSQLTRLVLEAALGLVAGNGLLPVNGGSAIVLGHSLSERGVRLGLEQAYRALARQAGTQQERVELVDLANRVRPRTLT